MESIFVIFILILFSIILERSIKNFDKRIKELERIIREDN